MNKRNAGFSLVEVTIASGILAMSMIMLLGAVAGVSAARVSVEEKSAVTAHLASISEEIQGMDWEQFTTYVPPNFNDVGLWSFSYVAAISEEDYWYSVPMYYLDTPPTTTDPMTGEVIPSSDSYYDPTFPNPVDVFVYVGWIDKANQYRWMVTSTKHAR